MQIEVLQRATKAPRDILQFTKKWVKPIGKKKKGKVHPLYGHWGSVQAVRPIGGVEV